MKPCIKCGVPSTGTRCPDHHLDDHHLTAQQRGYNSRWRRLSEKARKLQRFCSDCGSTTDLTADHSPEAWRRHNAGKPIRLCDIDVVCRSCNARRGKTRGVDPNTPGQRPEGKAQRGLHTAVPDRGVS